MKFKITFLTNNSCNKKCKYCYENNTGDKQFTLDKASYIIDRFIDHPGFNKHICFFGGEPTLNIDFIKQCIDKYNQLSYSIITNGYFLMNYDYERYNFLKNIKTSISLEGTSKAFLELRGENNLYKYLEKIKHLKDLGWNNITINISINGILSDNIDEFIRVCNFIKYIGCDLHLYSINGTDYFKNLEHYSEFLINIGKKSQWLLHQIIGYNNKDSDAEYLCSLENSITFNSNLELLNCARNQNTPISILNLSNQEIIEEWCKKLINNHISKFEICQNCEVPVGNCTRSCPQFILENDEKIIKDSCNKEIIRNRIRKNIINIEENNIDIHNIISKSNSIELILSKSCNMKCTYCFENIKTNKTMSPDTAKFILNNTLEICNDKYVNLTLFGGEPITSLTYDTRIEILNIIKNSNKKYNITIITNLLQLSDKDILWFNNLKQYCNKLYIQISLDSIKNINDKYRIDINNQGTFDKIINNIIKLSNNVDKKCLGINSVMHNIECIKNLPIWIQYLNDNLYNYIDNIMYSTNQSSTKIFSNEEYEIFKNSYQKIYELYKQGKLKLKFVKPLLSYKPENIKLQKTKGCTALETYLTFDNNGWLIPCHYDINNNYYKVYNIITKEYGLHYKEAISIFSNDDNYLCNTCEINNNCKRCKISGYYINGGYPTYTCDVTKALYKIKTDVCKEDFKLFTELELNEFKKDIYDIQKEIENGNTEIYSLLYEMLAVYQRRN